MSGFDRYDQWKTASPYDDMELNCDVCGRDVDDCKCPECIWCEEQGNEDCSCNGGPGCNT